MPQGWVSLRKLVDQLPGEVDRTVPDLMVTGIVLDSRQVSPGDLFVALKGEITDGHQFIPEAIARGAVAIVGSQPMDQMEVPYILVRSGRAALAFLSAAFYGHPSSQLTIIGVTGTDGKTTTCHWIYHVLKSAGKRVGMITTVKALIGNEDLDTGLHVTTPESPVVQRYLSKMVAAGLDYVVLEATSHGLAQRRLDTCQFDIAVVTNITHEHLDYHGSYKNYREAKARLFVALSQTPPKAHSPPRAAVLNLEDSSYDYLSRLTKVRQITYGFGDRAQVRARNVVQDQDRLRFLVEGEHYHIQVESPMVGTYNVSNCLAVVATTVDVLGLAPRAAQEGVATLTGIPGRMETFELGQDFTAIVDFAHTPNALRQALHTARQLTNGKVIAIFGSAGLRDREKRRLMAEVSIELADVTILTAEDPRTESLADILSEMAAGAEARGGVEGRTFYRFPDRGEAIRFGCALARPGDLVIACGKGHEQSMCFGRTEYPWDDRIAMQAALSELLNVPGSSMPYLPTQDQVD